MDTEYTQYCHYPLLQMAAAAPLPEYAECSSLKLNTVSLTGCKHEALSPLFIVNNDG